MKDKVLKILSFGSMAIIIIAMMAATVFEKTHGTSFALAHFYHSPWFIALWMLAVVCGSIYL